MGKKDEDREGRGRRWEEKRTRQRKKKRRKEKEEEKKNLFNGCLPRCWPPPPFCFPPRGVHGPETMGLYIVGGTCVRNRINLSLGNYKKPYIRQPATRRLGYESCSTLVERSETRSRRKGGENWWGKVGSATVRKRKEEGGGQSSFRFAGVPAAITHLSPSTLPLIYPSLIFR